MTLRSIIDHNPSPRQQLVALHRQEVMIDQGLTFHVGAMVLFQVADAYRATFEVVDVDGSLRELAAGVLRDVLSSKQLEELHDTAHISRELFSELEDKTRSWGLHLLDFRITDCAPTAESAPIVNARVAATMKMEAVRVAARDFAPLPFSDTLAAALVGVPVAVGVGSADRLAPNPKDE